MNAPLPLSTPDDRLPAILDASSGRCPARRRRIDRLDLATAALERFNDLLARLDKQHAPLDADRIASAARELCDRTIPQAVPACIALQLKRATALICMLGDPTWATARDAAEVARLVIDYLRSDDGLIPDRMPQVGRLDDAILIQAAWPRVSAELDAYIDFCRVRRIEAGLRGVSERDLPFTRTDWEIARHSEAALSGHRREVRAQSYLPASAMLFRVH